MVMKRSFVYLFGISFCFGFFFLQESDAITSDKYQASICDTSLAGYYYKRGKGFLDSTMLDSAIANFEKSAQIYKQFGVWSKHLDAINRLGYIWIEKKKSIKRSRALCDYALQTGIEKLGENTLQMAETYYVIAIIYMHSNYSNQAAISYLTKSLNIRRAILGEEHWLVARIYMVLGNAYNIVDFDLSMIYHRKSIALNKKIFGDNSMELAEAYGDFALQLRFFMPDSAMKYFKKAINLYEQNNYPEKSNLMVYYQRLAEVYFNNGEYTPIEQLFDKAIAISDKYIGSQCFSTLCLLNCAESVYRKTGNKEKLEEILSKKRKRYTGYYTGLPDTSLHFQASLFVDNDEIIDLLSRWDKIWLQKYRETGNRRYLIHALRFSLFHDSVICLIQRKKQSFSEMLTSSHAYFKINKYDNTAVSQICYLLAQTSKTTPERKKYATLCYYFANNLNTNTQYTFLSRKNKAKQLLNDSLLKQYIEAHNTLVISNLQNAIYRKTKQHEANNLNIFHAYQKIVQLDSIMDTVDHYATPLFNYNLTKDIQNELDSETAVINYFITDSLLFVFTLTQQEFNLATVRIERNIFESQVDKFVEQIMLQNTDKKHYAEQSYSLYCKLFPEPLSPQIKQLVIIPNKSLSYLPYEALISKRLSRLRSFKRMPYLLRDYRIKYCSSAILFLQMQKRDDEKSGGLLAFAPVFENKTTTIPNQDIRMMFRSIDSTMNDGFIGLKRLLDDNTITALPKTRYEVQKIHNCFMSRGIDCQVFLHDKASELAVKNQDLKKYDYIHFATHGFANPINPHLCGLIASQNHISDTIANDGVLFFDELFILDLDARLVTLSACETGVGKLFRIEGNLSLSSALLHAGALNVMSSLWKVSDDSTADLMIRFYKNVLQQENLPNYSFALQKAKLKAIRSRYYSHPFFWSAFVLSGK